jgi:hypothetical protein
LSSRMITEYPLARLSVDIKSEFRAHGHAHFCF